MEITGKIISIERPTSGVSKAGKEWTKQEFVIETKEQYPRKVMISVMGDKVDELSHYHIGNEITCGINIESREYNGRWYTDIKAWKISGSSSNAQSSNEDPFHPDDNEPSFTGDNSTDDLPF